MPIPYPGCVGLDPLALMILRSIHRPGRSRRTPGWFSNTSTSTGFKANENSIGPNGSPCCAPSAEDRVCLPNSNHGLSTVAPPHPVLELRARRCFDECSTMDAVESVREVYFDEDFLCPTVFGPKLMECMDGRFCPPWYCYTKLAHLHKVDFGFPCKLTAEVFRPSVSSRFHPHAIGRYSPGLPSFSMAVRFAPAMRGAMCAWGSAICQELHYFC